MRKLLLIVCAIAWGHNAFAQNKLSGKVLDSLTHEPIAFANVFLANASFGAVTSLNGEFSFQNFPSGKYDVTISFVGYTTVQRSIDFSNEQKTLTIYLSQQVVQLKEIYVRADTSGWKRNFEQFKLYFVGDTKNSLRTEIINPRAVYLYFDPDDRLLLGFGKKSIEIENRALGYKLYYELKDFQLDYRQGKLAYFGIPRFEPLGTNRKSEAKRWEGERQRAYNGSFTHFIQCLRQNNLAENGFEVHALFRVQNRNRPDDAYLSKRINYWREKLKVGQGNTIVLSSKHDSLAYYLNLRSMPKVIDSVGRKITDTKELFNKDNDVIKYTGLLKVSFGEPEEEKYAQGRKPQRIQQSVVHLLGKELRVYDNGYYEDVKDVFLEGYLGWSEKIAELLPLDYQPPKPKVKYKG
jgi:hypothetical protein